MSVELTEVNNLHLVWDTITYLIMHTHFRTDAHSYFIDNLVSSQVSPPFGILVIETKVSLHTFNCELSLNGMLIVTAPRPIPEHLLQAVSELYAPELSPFDSGVV